MYLKHKEIGVDVQVILRPSANTAHDSAEDWYASYGAHVSTEEYGDVSIQAVDYDWLDGDDVAEKVLEDYPEMSEAEADKLVERARDVRYAAEGVCDNLDDAVTAYKAGDLAGVIEALEAASSVEGEGGDDPATQELAERLLVFVPKETT